MARTLGRDARGGDCSTSRHPRSRGEGARASLTADPFAPARCWRSPIRSALRRIAAAGGAFLLANGRGANVDPASALAREPFLAVAEIAGTAAQGRILLAAPIALAEIEARIRRSHREPGGHRVR